MKEFLSQLENHQAIVAIIIFAVSVFIGIISFFIKKIFFQDKQKKSATFIKAGGSISAGGDITGGDKTVHNTTTINSETTHNLKTFERYLEEYRWNKEFIEQKEVWICEYDNLYQIEIGERNDNFTEAWTKVYPASNESWQKPVYLKIGGNHIKQLLFVAMDGGRIFVPLPEINSNNDQISYYWERNSLEFKVGRIVGEYYIYNSLEGIAERSKIEIKN